MEGSMIRVGNADERMNDVILCGLVQRSVFTTCRLRSVSEKSEDCEIVFAPSYYSCRGKLKVSVGFCAVVDGVRIIGDSAIDKFQCYRYKMGVNVGKVTSKDGYITLRCAGYSMWSGVKCNAQIGVHYSDLEGPAAKIAGESGARHNFVWHSCVYKLY